MNRYYLILYILSYFVSNNLVHGYVLSRTDSGIIKSWGSLPYIPVVVSPLTAVYLAAAHDSAENFTAEEFNTLAQNSVSEWNQNSALDMLITTSSEGDTDGKNNIYVSTSPDYFGGGILGVTTTLVNSHSGQLLESDIIINGMISFSKSENGFQYLGDVLTHELGHLLGLSHSEVLNSTMHYQWDYFQSSLSKDDISAIYSLYDSSSSKGSISGKIVGGPLVLGILGATVEAVSVLDGHVIAGTISDMEGVFKIDGLDLNDSYYIYTRPTVNTSATVIPAYYSPTRSDFCTDHKQFVGSFFQKCHAVERGSPQPIALSSAQTDVNVGNITVRCGIDNPPDYFNAKDGGSMSLIDYTIFNREYGESIIGYFTQLQIDNSEKDQFTVDLSGIDFASLDSESLNNQTLYLKVNVSVSFSFGKLNTGLYVNRSGIDERSQVENSLGSEYLLDRELLIPISSTFSENIFQIDVRPQSILSLSEAMQAYGAAYKEMLVYEGDDVDGDGDSDLADGELNPYSPIYLLMTSIVKKEELGSVEEKWGDYVGIIEDNTTCPDGPETYLLHPYVRTLDLPPSRSGDDSEFGSIMCGTISTPSDPPGSGPIQVVIGFLIIFTVSQLQKVKKIENTLSKFLE